MKKIIFSILLWALAFLAIDLTPASAQVPVFGTTVDAKTGYTQNGVAPLHHTLCGNGTVYVDSSTPCTTATIFYQSIHNPPGTTLPQEGILTFDARIACSDNAGISTECDLANSGVTAGNYANPSSITVDAFGRVTNIVAGTKVVVASVNFTSCAFVSAGSTDQNCVSSASWGTTITGTYAVSCIIGVPFAGPSGTPDTSGLTQTTWGLSGASPLGTTGFNYYVANQHSAAVGLTVTMSCIAVQ